MQLFYNDALDANTDIFSFSKEESRHLVKVLRKSTGDSIDITNGKGWMFKAEIIESNPKSVQAKIIEKKEQTAPKYHLHMAVAPTKNIDRFEWFLEKATEIGISEITPIICEHSERKIIKTERLNRILLSAVKQSLNAYIPKVNTPISFQEFIHSTNETYGYIAHCEDSEKQALFKTAKPESSVVVLIGPEGDFSVKEIEMAISKNYIPVTLGTSRLRTETAALVACHTIALINE